MSKTLKIILFLIIYITIYSIKELFNNAVDYIITSLKSEFSNICYILKLKFIVVLIFLKNDNYYSFRYYAFSLIIIYGILVYSYSNITFKI